MSIGARSATPERSRGISDLLRIYRAAPRIPTREHLAEKRVLVSIVAEMAPAGEPSDLDWRTLANLAARYAIIGPTWSLLEPRFRQKAPREIAQALEDHVRHLSMQNRVLLEDASTIARALSKDAIPHVFMKGTALLAGWPRLTSRHTDDIDLLVDSCDLERTERALAGAGFVRFIGKYDEQQHPLLMTSALGTTVEVHVEVGELTPAIWSSRTAIDLRGTELFVPSTEVLVEHLCHHVLFQHAAIPRYLPRHLVDLAAIFGADLPSTGSRFTDASLDILSLVRASSSDRIGSTLIASMMFPRRHTVLPLAIEKRIRGGYRGARIELGAIRRAVGYALFDPP